jgi:hypothetical protein
MQPVKIAQANQRTGQATPRVALVRAQHTSHKQIDGQDDLSAVESAVSMMKATAFNFATRFINDDAVRRDYVATVNAYAEKLLKSVKSGEISHSQGMTSANSMRNQIMEAARLKLSDMGLARSQDLKPNGLSLKALKEKYSGKLFNKAFDELAQQEKNQVALEIIEASGRANPAVTTAARTLGRLGRGLIIISAAVAVYDIAVAKDKGKAAAREGAIFGGGFLGGAAGGAAAGLLFGPGAPIAVPVGIFIGGMLGALGVQISFDSLVH